MDKKTIIHSFFKNRIGVLATMHKKEEVIAPILQKELGIEIVIPHNFNTDQFGTFTGDIKRAGSQIEAARYKAGAAILATGESLAFSSEGSFGPHPMSPFIPFNREIVMLLDKKNGLEVIGEATTIETNFNQAVIKSLQEAYDFSQAAGFPQHGIVIKSIDSAEEEPIIFKGIITTEGLEDAFNSVLQKSNSGEVSIETDMRALYNPTRMKIIEDATANLIKNIYNICPKCLWPGFKLVERKSGLPCAWCGMATNLTLSYVYSCLKCGYNEEVYYPNEIEKADPGNCQFCNP